MKIESISGKGDFALRHGTRLLCTLRYEEWFSSKASCDYQGMIIEIKPKNILSGIFGIHKNGYETGMITMNWKGHMVLKTINDLAEENSFLLKAKGVWKSRFELFDENDDLVLTLHSKGEWYKTQYDYEIEIAREPSFPDTVELLVYCGYAANLYIAMMSAA